MAKKTKDDPWIICPTCEGEGKTVNPNIDAHGLTGEDFAEDPDFAEDYFSGVYDIQCRCCDGAGKVRQSAIKRMRQAADDRRLRAMEDADWESYSVAGDWRYGY